MTQQNSLMAFLESAARHSTVNQELLRAQDTTAEPAVQEEAPYNQELMEYAMRNLGLQDTAASTYTYEDSQEDTPVVEEPALEEEKSEEEEGIPQDEKALEVPIPSSVREELVRFSDAEWFNKIQEKTIVLAGVGGIGSNMAVILAKLNPAAIYIFDGDTVDQTNIAGQFYSNEDVGKPKVDSLAQSVIKYTNYSAIYALNRQYLIGEEIVSDIMVCGFDNMRARRTYFFAWKNHVESLPEKERGNCLFIDGRLTADEFQIFCITGTDTYYMEEYDSKYLFRDYEVSNLRCSYKQTGFLANMIGSFMVNLIVNFCANQVNPLRNMTLPFMTSYKSSMMFLDFKR